MRHGQREKDPFVYERSWGSYTGKSTSSLHVLVISKSSCLLPKLFFTRLIDKQVNKGIRMTATLAEPGCLACDFRPQDYKGPQQRLLDIVMGCKIASHMQSLRGYLSIAYQFYKKAV